MGVILLFDAAHARRKTTNARLGRYERDEQELFEEMAAIVFDAGWEAHPCRAEPRLARPPSLAHALGLRIVNEHVYLDLNLDRSPRLLKCPGLVQGPKFDHNPIQIRSKVVSKECCNIRVRLGSGFRRFGCVWEPR